MKASPVNAQERVHAYKRQKGVALDKPWVLTPKQRRRVKQKARRAMHLEEDE